MISVDLKSRTPIYEQLIENIKSAILAGYLKPDEQLPAVRRLASNLAINPNTIQKAYAMLESAGIVYSVPGRGSFVSNDVEALATAQKLKIVNELRSILKEARKVGVEENEITEIINEIWKKERLL